MQYKSALGITGAIRGTSREKIDQELGLESLKSRRWYRRLSCMFEIMKMEATNYLIKLLPKCEKTVRTRSNHIPTYNCRTNCFKYSFFPFTLNDWLNLDADIRNSESISIFKSRLLSFIRPVQRNIYDIFDTQRLKFLTRVRLPSFSHHRIDLMNSVNSVLSNFESLSDNNKKDVILYGDSRFDGNKNKFILEATITFLKDSLDPFLIMILL